MSHVVRGWRLWRGGRRAGVAVSVASLVTGAVMATPAVHADEPHTLQHIGFIRTAPELGVISGARILGDHLYVTGWYGGLAIYEVRDATRPALTGALTAPLPAGGFSGPFVGVQENEDPATNGRIALVTRNSIGSVLATAAEAGSELLVVDVRDKNAPRVTAIVPNAGQHSYACVDDCRYAYGTNGLIVDLRDPSKPVVLQSRWNFGTAVDHAHDLTTVDQKSIMTASKPIALLDTKDPERPSLVHSGSDATSPERHNHTVIWPRAGSDRFLLTVGEDVLFPRCDLRDSLVDTSFAVYEARDWLAGETLQAKGTYKLQDGTYTDGNPAAVVNFQGCSNHSFDPHPKFHNGGLVALAAYSHGARLLHVSPTGAVTAQASFFPTEPTSITAALWRDERTVYAFDQYQQGIHVLHYGGALQGERGQPQAVVDPRADAGARFRTGS